MKLLSMYDTAINFGDVLDVSGLTSKGTGARR